MAVPTTPARFFSKVKEARELLKEQSLELYQLYRDIIAEAREAGEFEIALKHTQWLIDHMPADAGERIVEGSSDKQTVVSGPTDNRPRVQIGIQLGGVNMPKPTGNGKALPRATAEIIDADTE